MTAASILDDPGFGIPALAERVRELEERLCFPREWAIRHVSIDCELRSEATERLREYLTASDNVKTTGDPK